MNTQYFALHLFNDSSVSKILHVINNGNVLHLFCIQKPVKSLHFTLEIKNFKAHLPEGALVKNSPTSEMP